MGRGTGPTAYRLVAVLAEPNGGDEVTAFFADRLEQYPLPLPEGAEHGSPQGAWSEEHLGSVGVTHDYAGTRDGVVGLDDALVHARESRP